MFNHPLQGSECQPLATNTGAAIAWTGCDKAISAPGR